MPVLNMEVPINTEAYYRGETIARREGVSLYDKFAQWLNEYIEDADDAAALNDAIQEQMLYQALCAEATRRGKWNERED